MIRRLLPSIFILTMLPLLLSGCWDLREIQDINYLTALGVDYKEGNYIIYAQMLDFSSVAKQEGGKPSEDIPVWVGKGIGKNLSDALQDIYTTNQQQLSWGQVTALVLTEAMMKPDRMAQIFDMTNRSQEIRYTKWVYGTKGRLENLFTTTPFFKLSPLHSLLHEPMQSYRQNSFIRPIQFNEFILHYREKGGTVVLPSLSLSDANWSENMRQHPVLEINGAFLIRDKLLRGWLKREELLGVRWLADRRTQAPVLLGSPENPVGSIMMQQPRATIELLPAKDEAAYRIKLTIEGRVQGFYKEKPIKELKKMAEDAVRDEMMDTFRNAVAIQADPYQLSLKLYQKKPKLWNKLHKTGEDLTPASLKASNIDININLRFWGQRKRTLD